MLPSTDVPGLLGSSALLAEHIYEEAGMRLDPEGYVIVGGRFLSPVNTKSLHDDRDTTARVDDRPAFLSPVSSATLWERNAARLCQRVRDVQTLVQEDLREINEPLTTLGEIASKLSGEHAKQWEAAKAAYDQALLECTQILERVLSPFTETPETLEQRRDLADSTFSLVEAVSR